LTGALLQALGVETQVVVQVSFAELKRGDLLLLCSDGLSSKLTSEELWGIVTQATDPGNACRWLIEAAKERGGDDNITTIVARFDGEGLPRPSSAEEIPICREFPAPWKWSIWPWGKP
jgi:protein phosphatase